MLKEEQGATLLQMITAKPIAALNLRIITEKDKKHRNS